MIRVRGERRSDRLDLSAQVLLGAEQGLLGIAFHPDFATTGRLFLHWSDRRGDTRVGRVPRRTAQRPRAAASSTSPRRTTTAASSLSGLTGGSTSASATAAARSTRASTRRTRGRSSASCCRSTSRRREPDWRVALTGLRNPWRFSFDPALGEVWIGDVGQDEVEEVNRVLLEPDEPPKNLGWDAFEGDRRTGRATTSRSTRTRRARLARRGLQAREDGCSVIGGYVYQGARCPRLSGRYLYGDFCSGALWSLRRHAGGRRATDVRRERAQVPQLTHIGPDADGEPVFASRGRRDLPRGQPRSALDRVHRPVDPHPHAVAGMPGREARAGGCAAAARSAARGATSWSWPKKERSTTTRPRRRRRAAARGRSRSTPAAARPRPRRSSSRADAEAAELALDDSAVRRAGQHVGLAEELGEPAGARALVDLLGRADLLDAPVAHDRDGVGQRQRLGLVVGDEQRAGPGVLEDPSDLQRAASRAGRRRARRTARRAGPRPGPRRARGPARPAGARRPTARAGRRRRGREPDEREALGDALAARRRRRRRWPSRVRCGNSAPSWKTIPIRRCSGSTQAPSPATGCPPIATAPRRAPRSRR